MPSHTASHIWGMGMGAIGNIWSTLQYDLILAVMSFSLLQSAITCLKGSRSSKRHLNSEAIDLVCVESHLDHLELDDT